jgi:hypothetical protein
MFLKKALVYVGIILTIIVSSCEEIDIDDYGKDYTITFNADGGTGNVPSPMTVHAEYVVAEVILPDTDLIKGESKFIGWREPESALYSRPGEKIIVLENTELKAVYEKDNNTTTSTPTGTTPTDGNNSGLYVTATGNKYHKYGHMGATIPLSQDKHGPYTACKICF